MIESELFSDSDSHDEIRGLNRELGRADKGQELSTHRAAHSDRREVRDKVPVHDNDFSRVVVHDDESICTTCLCETNFVYKGTVIILTSNDDRDPRDVCG